MQKIEKLANLKTTTKQINLNSCLFNLKCYCFIKERERFFFYFFLIETIALK